MKQKDGDVRASGCDLLLTCLQKGHTEDFVRVFGKTEILNTTVTDLLVFF